MAATFLLYAGAALAEMNATGRIPSNDNTGELRALRMAVETNTRVVMAAGQLSAEQQAGIRLSNARIADGIEQLLTRRA